MEFEEMKKIWDAQNNQPLYVIDENALHHRIQSKRSGLLHITNRSEWSLMMINLSTGIILLALNPFKPGANIFMYLESAWMFATVVYVVVSRIDRIKAGRRFDRSIHGDLDHAISVASYQVRLSRVIRWNLLPMGAIMIFSGWEAGKLVKVCAVILVAYALAFYVGTKERRMNNRRKRELQVLKEKLETNN
jgi:hypothetical protein